MIAMAGSKIWEWWLVGITLQQLSLTELRQPHHLQLPPSSTHTCSTHFPRTHAPAPPCHTQTADTTTNRVVDASTLRKLNQQLSGTPSKPNLPESLWVPPNGATQLLGDAFQEAGCRVFYSFDDTDRCVL